MGGGSSWLGVVLCSEGQVENKVGDSEVQKESPLAPPSLPLSQSPSSCRSKFPVVLGSSLTRGVRLC